MGTAVAVGVTGTSVTVGVGASVAGFEQAAREEEIKINIINER
jgi:hypothetical protein